MPSRRLICVATLAWAAVVAGPAAAADLTVGSSGGAAGAVGAAQTAARDAAGSVGGSGQAAGRDATGSLGGSGQAARDIASNGSSGSATKAADVTSPAGNDASAVQRAGGTAAAAKDLSQGAGNDLSQDLAKTGDKVLGDVTGGIEKAVGGQDVTTPVKDLGVPAVPDPTPVDKSDALLGPVVGDVPSVVDRTVDHQQVVADVQERVARPADKAAAAAIPADQVDTSTDQVGASIGQVATPIVRAPAPAGTERSAPSPGPGGSPPDARRLSAMAVTPRAGAADRPSSSRGAADTQLADSP